MKFLAIDVETSNPDLATICSVGVATFEHANLTSEWYSLVNPEDDFDEMNVRIHGIKPGDVRGASSYAKIAMELNARLEGAVVVTHTHFDRVAVHQASIRAGVSEPNCRWIDSARVARRTWASCARSGYGLAEVCKLIGHEFEHHHALEDAKASGQIMLAAMRETGLDLDGWLNRVRLPIDLSAKTEAAGSAIRRNGNPDGPLDGEVIVFTGALSLPRWVRADLAASVGCKVETRVTEKTTILVVGDLEVRGLASTEKTTKHCKAEELARKGAPIRIIRESDFVELVEMLQ